MRISSNYLQKISKVCYIVNYQSTLFYYRSEKLRGLVKIIMHR